jgi:hypothetical protein
MYLNNFIDRAALGQARLSTLEEDLGMTGTDFNLSISILFVGYLTMQLPSNLLITRVRPCKYSLERQGCCWAGARPPFLSSGGHS